MKIKIEKIYWKENRKEANKKELNDLLNKLPAWRLEKALSFHFDIDKYLCAKSFLLLQDMFFKEYNLKNIPKFSYKKNGKPYFKEFPNIHFNISHCKSGVACAINSEPIGIDVEEIFFDEDIFENILSDDEQKKVLTSKFKSQELIRYWTLKESYLKLTGDGIHSDIKNVLKDCDSNVEFKTFLDKANGIITSVARFNKTK